ncbi:uncharacterized protein LOC114828027, partial [Galendromus occidentalis]|uniref:Uncharacterized protein LOC114828027 n=1 Tax=Galendromus occidentalis TaxID=34638 RepID=A0AAJ7SCW0_9ACAR
VAAMDILSSIMMAFDHAKGDRKISDVEIINGRAPEAHWPKLENLKELYLEGVPRVKSAPFLRRLLTNFPNLDVLDLEGTQLNEDDIVAIAQLLPNLRELYLGHTGLRDTSIMRLVSSGCLFERLQIVCLCETNISDVGLETLVSVCPSLRSVTVKRSLVSSKTAEALQALHPGLQVDRVAAEEILHRFSAENSAPFRRRPVAVTHIMAVFPDQGCDRFSLKHHLRSMKENI